MALITTRLNTVLHRKDWISLCATKHRSPAFRRGPTSFFWTVGDNLPATPKATGSRRRSNCEKTESKRAEPGLLLRFEHRALPTKTVATWKTQRKRPRIKTMAQNWKTLLSVAGAAAAVAGIAQLKLRHSRRISVRNKTVDYRRFTRTWSRAGARIRRARRSRRHLRS
jgi:hypothetical protein